MTRPNSKEFKALQKHWYKKLHDSGFEDIEQQDGNLKEWHSFYWMRKSDGSFFSAPFKQEYYRLAVQFLSEYRFESKLHKKVWELHADGVSMRDISKALCAKKSQSKGLSKSSIYNIIEGLSKEMMKKCRTE